MNGAALDVKGAVTTSRAVKTGPDYSPIPQELKELRQWIVWKYGVDDKGRPTKYPYQPHAPRRMAKTKDTENPGAEFKTWNTFEMAVRVAAAERFDGVGFVFTETDLYIGIDLDHCRDPQTGIIEPWAWKIIKLFNSYWEISPSVTGVHIFVKGKLPPGRRKAGDVEMYEAGRYFTMTGNHHKDAPATIEPRQAELEALHREVFGEPQEGGQEPTKPPAMPLDSTDEEIIARARAATNGSKFDRLFSGNMAGYPSQNEADLALCSLLAFWTRKDPEQMDHIFRQSGLMRPKWDRPTASSTYGRKTIEKAIANTKEVYEGRQSDRDNGGKRPMPGNKLTGEDPQNPFHDAATPKGKVITLGVAYHLTDMGNAQRLVFRHGKDLRYCYPWRKWLVWNGTRWKQDDTGEVERLAKDTVRSILAEAAAAKNEDRAKELAQFALKCQAENKRGAMIETAKSEPGIPVLPEHLDRDPWLLNVLNGTLDLRTGTLRSHNQADLITKLAPVEYDPQAKCPGWWAFLDKILAGNGPGVEFLQKAVGYALTGDTREQCLFFLYGLGANGKSTFLNIIQAFLGDYATQTSSETLMIKHIGGNIPNDVAALKGARFVATVEVEAGRRMAEALLKQMTGGDKIPARFMRGEWFEFDPEFKIFLAANHKPVIKGTDSAIWRRIHLLPFTVQIPEEEQDKTLPEKLRAELTGIFNWAVGGCLQWQHEGLNPPDTVRAATQGYREEMDPLGGFLAECCIIDPEAEAMAAQIYKAYTAWAEENGEKKIMSQKELGGRLSERGFKCEKENKRGENRGKVKWLGIDLNKTGE